MASSGKSDIEENRDYWFQVANDQIDFLDWLMDTHLPGYSQAELQQEYQEYLDKQDMTPTSEKNS